MEYRKELAKVTAKSYRYFKFQTWVCQNVFNEVSLIWFTFQAKILSRSWVCVQGECQKYSPSSSPLSKYGKLRDIGHSMSNGNLILDVKAFRFHIWFIMTVYYKIRQILLQNATAILLQNTAEVYYKMCEVFYYKMRQLLQVMTILLQNATFITNCDSTIWNHVAIHN